MMKVREVRLSGVPDHVVRYDTRIGMPDGESVCYLIESAAHV